MNFLLSINKKFFPDLSNRWIHLVQAFDYKNIISGFEFYIDHTNIEQQNYILNLLKDKLFKDKIVQFHAPDFSRLLKQQNGYENLLEFYNKISEITGYKIKVTFHPVSFGNTIDDCVEKTALELCKINNLIEEHNLKIEILIENLNKIDGLLRCNLESLQPIIEIPNVKLTWDIGHQVIDNQCNYALNSEFCNKLENIHIHDIGKADHYPFDYGKTDLLEVFKYLSSIKYGKSIVCEIALDYLDSCIFEEKIEEYINNVYKASDVYNKINKSDYLSPLTRKVSNI